MSPVTFNCRQPFDLTVSFSEKADGLEIGLIYSLDLFETQTMRRMVGHMETLITGALTNPDHAVGTLPLLTEVERRQVLDEWNRTLVPFPQTVLLHQLVETQSDETPGAVAVEYEGSKITYHELDARANQLAAKLRAAGVGPDVLVGLCVERSLEMVIGLLGVLKAGGAYVPIDPAYPVDRIAFMIADARLPVLLTQEKLRDVLPPHQALVLCLDSDWSQIAKQPRERISMPIEPSHLAYVIYTSGSTGKPKGVMIPHSAITNHMRWMQRVHPLSEQDCVLQKTPFSFDASVWEFYAPLMSGGRLMMAKPQGHLDAEYLARTIKGGRVTILQLVPSLLRMLLTEPEFAGCTTLKRVFCGGETLTLDLQEEFFKTLPQSTLHNHYGPTEAAIDSTSWDCVRDTELAILPIGRPVDNAIAYITDANLQPVPIGVPGELLIGGAGLARGYFDRPELTREKFIANPFGTGRVYRTGDLARWMPDGNIEFLGRLDHQVKLRGFRIELGEIEAVLGRMEGVLEAAVVMRGFRAGDQRLVAYCSVRPGFTVTPVMLRDGVRAALPDYMVPAHFILLEELPHTPNGKVDRKALPEPGGMEGVDSEGEFVPARTITEQKLAAIWAELLGVQKVSIHSNFFDLGGHSLLAVRLFSRIQQEFGRKLPLASLFQSPTVAQLAALIEADATGEHLWSSLVAIRREGRRPPFFCVHGGGGEVLFARDLMKHLDPETPFYGIQARGLDKPDNRAASIEEMAAHYIKEMKTVLKDGPVYLGGYCMGGLVAYEMAQQLIRDGRQIGLLVLIDAHNPVAVAKWGKRTSKVSLWRQKLMFQLGNLKQLKPVDMAGYLVRRSGAAIKWRSKWVLSSILRLIHGQANGKVSSHVDSVRNEEYSARLWWKYHPEPIEADVLLFRPQKQFEGLNDPDMGWGEFVRKNLEVVTLPVNPGGMLVEPFIGMLGKGLRSRLNTAQDQNDGPQRRLSVE